MERWEGLIKKSVHIYSHDYHSYCKTTSAVYILINEKLQKI